MLFMNEYEIDEAVRRFRGHALLGPATQTLANLRDCADANSDGWCYWPKPCRAAKQLQELIQAARRNGSTPTVADVRKAYRPIKSFLTRQGLQCEIVEV